MREIYCVIADLKYRNCTLQSSVYTLYVYLTVSKTMVKIRICKMHSPSPTPLVDYEPRHEKTCLRCFRPGQTQTGLLSYRS